MVLTQMKKKHNIIKITCKTETKDFLIYKHKFGCVIIQLQIFAILTFINKFNYNCKQFFPYLVKVL